MIQKRTPTFLALMTVLTLAGCSTVSDIFSGDDEKKPLAGERISVLELEQSLEAEATEAEVEELTLPEAWRNAFWPQPGGYPNHSMQNLDLSDGLSEFWTADIGEGSDDDLPLTAQPLVVNDRIFTLDAEGVLMAFDANNGNELWETDLVDPEEEDSVISGGIAFSAGAIYATNGFNEVLAIKPENGDIVWRKDLPVATRAAPTIMDGRVYVTMLDNRLLALDGRDGTVLWEYSGLGEAAGLLGAASPAANRDIVVPVFSSGEITALRVENGSVTWSDNLSALRRFGGLASLSDIRGMPVLDQGLVIAVSFGGRLVALDERSGTRIWQREIGGSQTPWVAGNVIFLISSDSQIVALNRTNGLIYWVSDLPGYEDMEDREDPITWLGPVLAGDRLIVAGSHGQILEVNAESGDFLRAHDIDNDGLAVPPLVAGGVLYMLSNDGTLHAYR